MCGAILEIEADGDGLRRSCEACRRRFDVQFTQDPDSGRKSVSLLYISDENLASGETSTVGAGTTSFQLPSSRKDPAATGLAPEPELPDEAHFKCSCGVLLAVGKKQYEKRVRCPACSARMLVFMLVDAAAGAYTLQTFSLIDRSSGTTQVLIKL